MQNNTTVHVFRETEGEVASSKKPHFKNTELNNQLKVECFKSPRSKCTYA